MIKLIHKYNKIITYVFLFVAICFMFSGVGLDMLQNNNDFNRYAIKVNDEEISTLEFERAKQSLTERYRQMLGDNFESLAKSFNLNIPQQAVDSLIDSTLLSQEAAKWGFAGSDEAVTKYLITKVFAGREVTQESVRALLQNIGMNYKQFSAQVKEDVSRAALMDVLRDVSFVSNRAVEAKYSMEETTYSLMAATISQDTLNNQIQAPSDDVLLQAYKSSASSYEMPARASYEYLTFNPKDFEKDVKVSAQDIEIYYTENPGKFRTPEEARIRAITLLYPKENDPSAMANIRAKAKAAHEEAMSGKPFKDLVAKYSDDLPTKLAGGDRGWIQRGKGNKDFDKAVFAAKAGEVASLIESSSGFEIVLVEEKKPAGTKQFAEVKAEIESTLRGLEAPAYASAKASEVIAQAKKTNAPLATVAANLGLPVPKAVTLSQSGQDTDPLLEGLTKHALQIPPAERLIATTVEIDKVTVALQVKEFKEPSIRPFEEVKGQVLATYRKDEAMKLAAQKAQELLEIVKKDPANFASVAADKGFKIVSSIDISRAKPSNQNYPGLTTEMSKDAFAIQATPQVLPKAYRVQDSYVVAAVSKIDKPDLRSPTALEAIKKYRDSAQSKSSQQAITAVIALLKTTSEIDTNSSLLQ